MLDLKPFLDQLYLRYQQPVFLESDPLEFVHRYQDPHDQEVVAVLSALLAYGKVKQIRASVSDLLARIHGSSGGPAAQVRAMASAEAQIEFRQALQGFVHRFNVGEDILVLFRLLQKSWEKHGSLGAHFTQGLEPDHPHIEQALNRLMVEWKAWSRDAGVRQSGSFDYLLTAPEQGSCCKRWCMLLRWMGRQDVLDPGLWTIQGALASTIAPGKHLRPDQLVVPLDTHTGRLSQYLGLTRRKSLGWKAALEVTESLRASDPSDPVKYDFALARLGILDLCQKQFRVEICRDCELLPVCKYARRRSAILRQVSAPSSSISGI